MQTGLDAVGDHAGAIAIQRGRRGAREADGKKQPDTIGSAEIEILTNDGFEELPALQRRIEYLRETELELTDGKAMVISRHTLAGGHRPRQPSGPAFEECLDVGRTERIAGRLQHGGVGAGEKPIVETLEADPLAPQPLLHPLVPVETQLHRVRQVGPNLEERSGPLAS